VFEARVINLCDRDIAIEDYYYIDRVEVEEEDGKDGGDRDIESVEPINQYMALRASKFEVLSVDD